MLPRPFMGVLVAYFALSASYSVYLKRMVMIDVVTLAALYGIRVVAGWAASDISLSHGLVGFCFFIFLSLALGKRTTEIASLLRDGGRQDWRAWLSWHRPANDNGTHRLIRTRCCFGFRTLYKFARCNHPLPPSGIALGHLCHFSLLVGALLYLGRTGRNEPRPHHFRRHGSCQFACRRFCDSDFLCRPINIAFGTCGRLRLRPRESARRKEVRQKRLPLYRLGNLEVPIGSL